jgi:peptidoglycan/xylan/chitin deacetylase (PgdA/CDA1 family)
MNLSLRLSDGGLSIFLFHGVIESSDYDVRNYTNKHLNKDYFYRLITDLKKSGNPLSMDDVVSHYSIREPFPPRAFVVTFDDGFENNYSLAAPILKDAGVPATFYVTTDFIGNNHMSWIDRIEYCFEATPRARLSFKWDDTARSFRNKEDKIHLLDYLRNYVKKNSEINLDDLVSDIFSQCELDEVKKSNEPIDLKMNWEQVKELNNDDNFIIGGHSHHHKVLAFLNDSELEEEIKTSINFLNRKAGIEPRHYSYPEGLDYCYSDKVIKTLRSHGIVACPTAEDGINQLDNSLFHLKRIMA